MARVRERFKFVRYREIFLEYLKCFNVKQVAIKFNVSNELVVRAVEFYYAKSNDPKEIQKQLAELDQAAILAHTGKLLQADDRAIDRHFKYSIGPKLDKEQIVSSKTEKNALNELVTQLSSGLTEYQRAFDAAPQRFKGILSSTKAGKTYFCIYEILKEVAELKENNLAWWIAPTYKVAKIAFIRISVLLKNHSVPCKKNLAELSFEFEHGARLIFKSAEQPDNLYGEDVSFAVFDEFTRASEAAWHAIYSTLTATEGRATLIGNFTTAANWGVRMVKEKAAEKPKEYAYFKVTAWEAVDAGILKKEIVEAAQQDLHEVIFNALYLAEGSYDELALINFDAIGKMFEETEIAKGEMILTADIALQGSDLFVLIVWNGFKAIEIIKVPKSDGSEVLDIIRDTAEKHQIDEKNIIFDADGVGGFVSGFLTKAIPFRGNKSEKLYRNLRSRCYFELAKKINSGAIKIAEKTYQKEISEELQVIKRAAKDFEGKIGIVKKEHIRVLIGRSPDFADALMMRMYYELVPKTNKI